MLDAFWNDPKGALSWGEDQEGRRFLFLRPPGARSLGAIYTHADLNDWGTPGPVNRWNGDMERPTLRPSIRLGEWHGFVTHGELTAKPCTASCCPILSS